MGKTIHNTGSLTSMLRSKASITQFTRMEDGDVASIAASPCLKQISSMCNGKGLPEKAKVEAFLKQRSENTQDDEVIVIKEEATALTSLPHRINDQAPLWVAEQSVKMEVCESKQTPKTFSSQTDIPNDSSIRKGINESIAKYQTLDDEQGEQYLTERMPVQKHDGSIVSDLIRSRSRRQQGYFAMGVAGALRR